MLNVETTFQSRVFRTVVKLTPTKQAKKNMLFGILEFQIRVCRGDPGHLTGEIEKLCEIRTHILNGFGLCVRGRDQIF
jgi:hypothetical protein